MGNNETFRTKVGGMVNKLKGLTNENDIVGLLQDINEEILKHEITAGQYTICPIWVEAYYNNNNFQDTSCHDRTNILGQFMFRKHNIGRGGVDLYLGNPDEKYYLSFLIKLALIKEEGKDAELCSQTKIVETIESCLNDAELRKNLECRLDNIKQEVNLDEYINEAKSKNDLEKYFNCNGIRDGLKRYLLDVVSPKLIFSPTSLDLDTNSLKAAKCKRVGLSGDEDDEYVNYELAACYEIARRNNNPRSYNTLKCKTDLYVLNND